MNRLLFQHFMPLFGCNPRGGALRDPLLNDLVFCTADCLECYTNFQNSRAKPQAPPTLTLPRAAGVNTNTAAPRPHQHAPQSPPTLGLDPEKLADFLESETIDRADGHRYNRTSGKRIAACVPMHLFGHAVRIEDVVGICARPFG